MKHECGPQRHLAEIDEKAAELGALSDQLEQAREEHALALQGQAYIPIPDEIQPTPLRTMG
jgi:hypothetical protein